MPSNHIGAWQGNGLLNVGPWQGAGFGTGPVFVTHPLSQTIEQGLIVTFTALATGTAPITYQWYRNGILQVGETSTTYDFITALSNDGDTVYCKATNTIGSADSNTAELAVFEVIVLTNQDYYTREQPTKSEELVNRVVVTTQPLIEATVAEEIFKMSEVFTLTPSETRDFVLYYKKQPALETGATTSLVDAVGATLTVSSETYYPWGVELTITNSDVVDGSAKVKVEGLPINVSGEESVVEEAIPEIKSYGLQEYIYPKNHLIQAPAIAERIASELLTSYKTVRKDTSIVWRGNPALELGDTIELPEYKRGATEVLGDFKIIKNKISYNGTLIETTDGRKV
tara:strand:+ start:18002 stop:19027 length:1026 start_codon:yes stop_codon:yes gene_type:complete